MRRECVITPTIVSLLVACGGGGAEPNRFRGLYGAARAAELSGDRVKAQTYYQRLLAIAEKADGTRPELRQARTYMVQK